MQASLHSSFQILLGVAVLVIGESHSCAGSLEASADDVLRTIVGDAPDVYTIDLAENEYVEVSVEQLGVDLALKLYGPDADLLFEIDSPTGDWDTEVLAGVVERSGTYRLELAAANAQTRGRYRLDIAHVPARSGERRRAEAARRFHDAGSAEIGGDDDAAAAHYRDALSQWTELADPAWEARCLRRIGTLELERRAAHDALEPLRRAAAISQQLRWYEQALSLYLLGEAYVRLDLFDQALTQLKLSRSLREQHGDSAGVVAADFYIARIMVELQQTDGAFEVYERAAAMAATAQLPGQEALIAGHLGDLQLSLGRTDDALEQFSRAERLARAAGDEQLLEDAWERRGQLLLQLGRAEEALMLVSAAAEQRRESGVSIGLPVDLVSRGDALRALGRMEEARLAYREALGLFVQLDAPRWTPAAQLGLARVARAEAHTDEALALIAQAEAAYRSQASDAGLAETLSEKTALLGETGELEAGIITAEEAAGAYERLRASTASLGTRATYFASVQRHFELYVDLLMALHARDPARGYDARALALSERARARSLLDQLAESPESIRRAADPALLAEENVRQAHIAALEQERLTLVSAPRPDGEALAKLDEEVRANIAELERVRRRIRASGLRAIGLPAEKGTLGLAEIRRDVLDSSTLLIEYDLGEARSYAWAVSAGDFRSATLPGRAELGDLVSRAVQGLAQSDHREGEATTRAILCRLSAQLLGPIQSLLSDARLAIVADESLHQLPFAALPAPDAACTDAEPLIARHEVVTIPSASALSGQRARRAVTNPAPMTRVAILADPVFEPADTRVQGTAGGSDRVASASSPRSEWSDESELVRATSGLEWDGPPPRLVYTRDEAQGIRDLAPDSSVFTDYDASKSLVLSGRLSRYRILHFATHAIVHPDQPELSGLVLSLVDAQGRWQDGFLRAYELYGLELPAEMVVLSACDTALGRELRGEGPASLARGFFAAGAQRVVMSLWPVHDRSTASLMAHFYRHVLVESRRPADALRKAQLEMRADDRWHAPVYWAGFALEGDWL